MKPETFLRQARRVLPPTQKTEKLHKICAKLPRQMIIDMDLLVGFEVFLSRGDLIRQALHPFIDAEMTLLRKRFRKPNLVVQR